MPGTLFIVATPIGNLEDISLRALRVLREADAIAAEDTRVTRKLLAHYDIHKPLIAYHSQTGPYRTQAILDLLGEGKDVALVSDAGTPGISDPGHKLIVDCIAAGAEIEAVPGPAALITALVVSGLATARFVFDGFPPRRAGERASYLRSLRAETRTVVLYESPNRLVSTLKAIRVELGDRRVAVIREVTKLFEEVFRGSIGEAIEHFSQGDVRGEVVIVLAGAPPQPDSEVSDEELQRRLSDLVGSGVPKRDAVKQLASELNVPKRRVYAAAIAIKPPL